MAAEMKTGRLVVSAEDVTGESLKPAVDVLLASGIVAFPTDTVYGLGVDATDSWAVDKLYAAKGRTRMKPVPLLISDVEMARGLVSEIPDTARRLIDAFWPGPLTLVMRAGPRVPPAVTGGTGSVGLRMPDSRVALELVKALSRPVAAPSANLSGMDEISEASGVLQVFDGRIDLVVDGGASPGGRPSTVVDVTIRPACLVREGALSRERLEGVVGRLVGPQRVIFVCTGNSCRSVMAEAMFRKMLEDRGIQSVAVSSAGVAASGDMPATPEVLAVMDEHGVEVGGHRSRLMTRALGEMADLIIVMAGRHKERVLELAPLARGKVFLLGEFISRGDATGMDVPDPIGHSTEFYRESAWLIREGLEGMMKRLESGPVGGIGPLERCSGRCREGGEGT